MKIVELCNDDLYLSQISNIHATAYDEKHFTSTFTINELEEYYSNLIEASDLSLCSIDEQGCVDGFIIAGENVSSGVSKFISNNKLVLVLHLLKTPQFLFQKIFGILKSRIYKKKKSNATFRLLSIAVSSACQSKGVGYRLISEFEKSLMKMGIFSYGLSVRVSNINAINFYINNGFKLEYVLNGTIYMIKNIDVRFYNES